MADGEAAAALGRGQGDRLARSGGGRGAGSASAVHAGVAELEALVDQREVGEQVVGCGVGDDRPVRVGAGAQAQALDPLAAGARRRSSSPRAGSRRGRSRSGARGRRRSAAAGRSGRVEQRRRGSSKRLPELERALLEPRLHVAGRPFRHDRGEALVGEPRAVAADVLRRVRRRARPARRRRAVRPRRRVTTPISGRRSWNEVLKRSSRQPRSAAASIAASSSRAGPICVGVEVELAAADAGRCRRGSGAR